MVEAIYTMLYLMLLYSISSLMMKSKRVNQFINYILGSEE